MSRTTRRTERGSSLIGIEIGTDEVRLVQPKRAGADEIRRAASMPTDQGVVDPSRLKSLARGFAGRDAVVSPPPGELELRPVRLPRLAGEELREAARWEVAPLLDVDGSDLVAEPIVISPQPGEDGRLEILVVAARVSRMTMLLEPVLEAGFRPVAVEPGFLATGRVFSRRSRRDAERDEVRLVVEVGESISWLVVMRGDAVVFAKSVAIGGTDFDREIARDLGITEDEARSTRLDAARGGLDDLVTEALKESVRRAARPMIDEAAMAIRYATVSARLGRSRAVHVTGPAGSTPGVAEAIDAAVPGVPLEVDHLLDARLGAHPEIAEHGGAGTWVRAFGLAIRPPVAREEAA